MLINKKLFHALLCAALVPCIDLHAHDIIVEFDGSYFLPTHCDFKNIYHHGSALYGPEITFQFCEDSNWYGFASVNYFQKKGCSVGLGDFTKVKMLPLGLGLKYLYPCWCDWVDVYAGLGFQPVRVKTENCSQFVLTQQTKWGFGGIAEIGTYIDLPSYFDCGCGSWVLDLFIKYSFVKVDCGTTCTAEGVTPRKANVSGAIFGGGLGYRF